MTESTEIRNVDNWIASLYDIDNEVSVEYAGKKLTFKKRFPAELAFRLQGKTQSEQTFTLIALQSKEPSISMSQASQLPLELVTLILQNISIDIEAVKKKLVQALN